MEKRVRILLISAIGVVVAIAATVAVLLLVLGREEVEKLNPETASSAEIIRVYTDASSEYWQGYETQHSSEAYAGLLLDDDGRTYEIPSDEFVLYHGADTRSFSSANTQASRLLSQISEFETLSTQDERILYQNTASYCQLRDLKSDASQVVLACAQKSRVDQQISLAKQLNALYAGQAEAVNFDFSGTVSLISESQVNDTIRYATISYQGVKSNTAEGYPRLLFGALNGEWEFVANLNDRSALGDGKRSVSEEGLARINDEKWQGVFNDVF